MRHFKLHTVVLNDFANFIYIIYMLYINEVWIKKSCRIPVALRLKYYRTKPSLGVPCASEILPDCLGWRPNLFGCMKTTQTRAMRAGGDEPNHGLYHETCHYRHLSEQEQWLSDSLSQHGSCGKVTSTIMERANGHRERERERDVGHLGLESPQRWW